MEAIEDFEAFELALRIPVFYGRPFLKKGKGYCFKCYINRYLYIFSTFAQSERFSTLRLYSL